MKDTHTPADENWTYHIAPGVRAHRPGAMVALFAALLGLAAVFYAWTHGERLAAEAAVEIPESAVSGGAMMDSGKVGTLAPRLAPKVDKDLPD